MITMQELAHLIDGREYGCEIPPDEVTRMKEAGLIVIVGASDDLVELHGAIDDEVGAYDGTTFRIDAEGVIPGERDDDWSDEEMERYFQRKSAASVAVTALWCPEDLPKKWAWFIKTEAPHAPFSIYEDGEPFCRGIVVELPKVSA
jgi:hypothetical protein